MSWTLSSEAGVEKGAVIWNILCV